MVQNTNYELVLFGASLLVFFFFTFVIRINLNKIPRYESVKKSKMIDTVSSYLQMYNPKAFKSLEKKIDYIRKNKMGDRPVVFVLKDNLNDSFLDSIYGVICRFQAISIWFSFVLFVVINYYFFGFCTVSLIASGFVLLLALLTPRFLSYNDEFVKKRFDSPDFVNVEASDRKARMKMIFYVALGCFLIIGLGSFYLKNTAVILGLVFGSVLAIIFAYVDSKRKYLNNFI